LSVAHTKTGRNQTLISPEFIADLQNHRSGAALCDRRRRLWEVIPAADMLTQLLGPRQKVNNVRLAVIMSLWGSYTGHRNQRVYCLVVYNIIQSIAVSSSQRHRVLSLWWIK